MFAIPSTPLSLCDALTVLNKATWLEIGVGIQTWQRLGEESITDFNLMRLAAAVPDVIIEKHNRHRESQTGADWEMWVGRPGAYLGFRIQAKLLTPESVTFESLYRSRTTASQQVEDLIISALSGLRPTYPLFAFYGHRLPAGALPSRTPCALYSADATSYGWTVTSAFRVLDVLRHTPTKAASAFDAYCYPISCLFCCPPECKHRSGQTMSMAALVANRIAQFFGNNDVPSVSALLHEVAPVYVERMFKGERANDGWERAGLPTPTSRFIPEDLTRVVLIRDAAPAA